MSDDQIIINSNLNNFILINKIKEKIIWAYTNFKSK